MNADTRSVRVLSIPTRVCRTRAAALVAAGFLLGSLTACGGDAPPSSPVAPDVVPAESAAAAEAARSALDEAAAGDGTEAPITRKRLAALLDTLPPGRAVGTEALREMRALLVSTLESFGHTPRVLPFTWPRLDEADMANVEVRIPGATAEAPWLLVGAHYDTVARSPGADDNGSGVVVLLELARRLRDLQGPAELRLVWFDAEEIGLLGSTRYVAGLSRDEAGRCLGAIVLETMGYTDRTPGSQSLPVGVRAFHDPGDRGDFLSVVGNLASAGLAARVGRGLDTETGPLFRADIFAMLPGTGLLLPDTRRSDHAPFWDAGIPALLVTDTANFRNPHYHTAGDTPDTLDLPFLAAAARGLEVAIRDIVAAPGG